MGLMVSALIKAQVFLGKIFTGTYRLIFYFHDLLLKGRFIEAKKLGKNVKFEFDDNHGNEFDGNHGCRSLCYFQLFRAQFSLFHILIILFMACNVTTETKFGKL